ncbi:hypothetical protein WAF17_03005 [Bernardetia sp. ABR2-2B]|uniref:hypothetical protein n=1 Tax=Bernardetia sp. ABR2-2B TaxID=3127472 RepID=UPI0030D16D93
MKSLLMQFIRWSFFLLWVFSSVIILALLSGTSESLFDLILYFIYFVWLMIGCGFVYFWYEIFEEKQKKIYLIPCGIVIVFFLSSVGVYLHKTYKMRKDYFLYAYHPTNSHHQWKYYFRDDNTLKVHGLYMMREEYNFYDFEMRGDTLFFDKILSYEGLESKVYLKQNEEKTDSTFLIPLDSLFHPVDSLEKMIVGE